MHQGKPPSVISGSCWLSTAKPPLSTPNHPKLPQTTKLPFLPSPHGILLQNTLDYRYLPMLYQYIPASTHALPTSTDIYQHCTSIYLPYTAKEIHKNKSIHKYNTRMLYTKYTT